MKTKREKVQVIYDILRAIKDKECRIKPTHIMYKANLSPQMLKTYLEELILKGLIMEKNLGKGKTYFLTEKGLKYIQQYKVILGFVDSFGLNE